MYKTTDLLDLDHTSAREYLSNFEYPWQALSGVGDLIIELIKDLNKEEYIELKENVWVHKNTKIADSACINGPCIVEENTEIRHCAFIRGSVLIGKDCVVGNSCELKNAILFDHVQVPHFNYVGDSILGYYSHLGAGAITSNVRSDKEPIKVRGQDNIETGLKKFGAIVGDYVEVGCNAVLNPGTVLARNSMVYPTACVRGVVKQNCIYKDTNEIIEK